MNIFRIAFAGLYWLFKMIPAIISTVATSVIAFVLAVVVFALSQVYDLSVKAVASAALAVSLFIGWNYGIKTIFLFPKMTFLAAWAIAFLVVVFAPIFQKRIIR